MRRIGTAISDWPVRRVGERGCGVSWWGASVGEEHRAAGAALQEAGQEAGGAGGPVHVLEQV